MGLCSHTSSKGSYSPSPSSENKCVKKSGIIVGYFIKRIPDTSRIKYMDVPIYAH